MGLSFYDEHWSFDSESTYDAEQSNADGDEL